MRNFTLRSNEQVDCGAEIKHEFTYSKSVLCSPGGDWVLNA